MTFSLMQRAAVLVSILGAAAPALADTIEVGVDGLIFVPADVKIDVGDTVHWAWKAETMPHNVESGVGGVHDDNFRSGDPLVSEDFSVVFDQAFLDDNPMGGNIYPYYCIVHLGQNMVGTVTVNAGGGDIPTVSQWGLILLVVLTAAAAPFLLRRRRARAA